MKIAQTFILFTFSIWTFAIEQIDLTNKISQNSFHRNNYINIYGNEEISNLKLFKKRIKSLDENKKKDLNLLVSELADKIPSELLRPIIYWRIISPNQTNLTNAIIFTMVYKANVLSDNYLSPIANNENKEIIRSEISRIYQREKFDINNLGPSLLKDFRQKAVMISNFKDLTNFITSIKETSSLSQPLPKETSIDPYSLSFTGYIPGNKVEIYNKDSLDQPKMTRVIEETINLKSDPTYSKTIDLINNAKSSIFISIKHIDGNAGKILLKLILDKAVTKSKSNPSFKVHLLYNKDSYLFADLSEKINANNQLQKNFFLIKTPLSKNYNTKVIVIDANTKSPEALIGTKSWSDHNGGYFFNNSIWVQGPAAALIQNSFYTDLGLSVKMKSEESKNNILNSFKITQKNYPYKGNQTVRIVESDVDKVVNNTRNIIIDMIKKAKTHIYIEQLYFYDTYITNALIKRKLEKPNLDIKIIIDQNEEIDLNGLPNSIYLRELKVYKIPVRSRVSVSIKKTSSDGIQKVYRQQNHRNTISIDGRVLLTSSASFSPDDLDGNSREVGLQIFSTKSIRSFDNQFLLSWHNRSKMVNLDIENFQIKTEDSTLSKELSSLINAIASSLMKAKEELMSKF